MQNDEDTELGKTQSGVTKSDFGPPDSRYLSIPVLSPVAGQISEPVKICSDEFYIGRQAGCHLQLRDVTVSRAHARITKKGDEYVLQDLESSHGTFVDNVPIVVCILRDGDTIQFGQHVFYFDRLLGLHESALGQ